MEFFFNHVGLSSEPVLTGEVKNRVKIPPLPKQPYSPCWFSCNNSETVQAVTLAFCSIQQHFIRDILAKLGIPNLPQSADIGQNSDKDISDFKISGQSVIKENRHNSWTSDDIDMKFGPVIKFHKRNKATCQKNLTMTSCQQNVTSLSFFLLMTNSE